MILTHNSPSRIQRLRGHGFVYQGHTYQVDRDSHTAIMSKAVRLQLLPVSVLWRDKHNNMVEFTSDEFRTFAVAVDDFVQALIQEQWS